MRPPAAVHSEQAGAERRREPKRHPGSIIEHFEHVQVHFCAPEEQQARQHDRQQKGELESGSGSR